MIGPRAEYLRAPARRVALPAALLLGVLYAALTRPRPHATLFVLALVAGGLALAIRLPRAVAYGLLLIALAVHVHGATQIEARGPQDAYSTRDDAVELGARALLAGAHVTAGVFVAHALVWPSAGGLAQDYALFFVLPAFLAVAETPGDRPG